MSLTLPLFDNRLLLMSHLISLFFPCRTFLYVSRSSSDTLKKKKIPFPALNIPILHAVCYSLRLGRIVNELFLLQKANICYTDTSGNSFWDISGSLTLNSKSRLLIWKWPIALGSCGFLWDTEQLPRPMLEPLQDLCLLFPVTHYFLGKTDWEYN